MLHTGRASHSSRSSEGRSWHHTHWSSARQARSTVYRLVCESVREGHDHVVQMVDGHESCREKHLDRENKEKRMLFKKPEMLILPYKGVDVLRKIDKLADV